MATFLADADVRVRSALRLLLEMNGVTVVGEAADAVAMVTGIPAAQPSVLCLDWGLPGLDLVHLSELRRRWPPLRLLVFSSHESHRAAALREGADLFVSKLEPPDNLVAAIVKLALIG